MYLMKVLKNQKSRNNHWKDLTNTKLMVIELDIIVYVEGNDSRK